MQIAASSKFVPSATDSGHFQLIGKIPCCSWMDLSPVFKLHYIYIIYVGKILKQNMSIIIIVEFRKKDHALSPPHP